MEPMISINNYKVQVSSNNLIIKKGFDALKYIIVYSRSFNIYFKAPSEGGSPEGSASVMNPNSLQCICLIRWLTPCRVCAYARTVGTHSVSRHQGMWMHKSHTSTQANVCYRNVYSQLS